jgi:hypothetical protein
VRQQDDTEYLLNTVPASMATFKVCPLDCFAVSIRRVSYHAIAQRLARRWRERVHCTKQGVLCSVQWDCETHHVIEKPLLFLVGFLCSAVHASFFLFRRRRFSQWSPANLS